MSARTTLNKFQPHTPARFGSLDLAGNSIARDDSAEDKARNAELPRCSRSLRIVLAATVLLAAATAFAEVSGGPRAVGPRATTTPPVAAHLVSALFEKPIGSGFQQPQQIAVDDSGNLYIADYLTDNVYKESLVDGVYTQSVLKGNLGGPIGVAVDSNGNVYISDSGGSSVVLKETLEPNGNYVESTVPTSGLGGIIFDLAVDSKGNIYIADTLNDQVVKETLSGSTYTQSVVASAANGLNGPEGVAVDPRGNVYIADTTNSRIVKETPSANGYTQSTVIPQVLPLGLAGVDTPDGMTYVNGALYVADSFNNRILKVTYNSTTQTYNKSTVSTGTLNTPQGVAVDAQGNVFITDTNNKRVVEDAQGENTDFGAWPVGTKSTAATLTFKFDNGGEIGAPVISGIIGGGVFANTLSGTCVKGATFATGDTCTLLMTFKPGSVGYAFGTVSLTDSSKNLIATAEVSGTGLGARLIFPNNAIDFSFGSSLKNSRGVAIDQQNNVYIADSGNNQVVKESPTSATAYAQTLVVKSLKNPTSVAVDRAGDVFITDSGNKRVIEETPPASGSTAYTQTVVYAAATNGATTPGPVAVDRDGNVWFALPGEIDEYSLVSGTWTKKSKITLAIENSHGVPVGLPEPISLAIDGPGNIYAGEPADSSLGLKMEVLRFTPGQAASGEVTVEQGTDPAALAVDRAGNVFLLDNGDNLHIYVPTGAPQRSGVTGGSSTYYIGLELKTHTALSAPEGIAVDGSDEVYIANTGASTILHESWASTPNILFPDTVVDTVSGAATQSILGIGNAPLVFAVPTSGQNPTISSPFVLNTNETDACPTLSTSSDPVALDPGVECSISVSLAPTTTGSFFGTLIYKANVNTLSEFQLTLKGAGIATIPNISWAAPASIAYGTALSATQLNATASYNGETVPGTFTYNPAIGTVLGAGTHTLSVQFVPSVAGYSSAGASVSITVTKVPLIAVADSFSRPYGSPNPTFTVSLIGLVNGDTLGSLDGFFAFSTEATQQFPWGYYPITVSNSSGQLNYDITYVDGTLVITQVPLTVTAQDVTVTNSSDIPNPYPCNFTGFVNGDTAAVVSGACATDAQNEANSPSGSYTVTPSIGTLSALNYTFTSFVPGTLTISESQMRRGGPGSKVTTKPVSTPLAKQRAR